MVGNLDLIGVSVLLGTLFTGINTLLITLLSGRSNRLEKKGDNIERQVTRQTEELSRHTARTESTYEAFMRSSEQSVQVSTAFLDYLKARDLNHKEP